MENPSHPVYNTMDNLRSSFSNPAALRNSTGNHSSLKTRLFISNCQSCLKHYLRCTSDPFSHMNSVFLHMYAAMYVYVLYFLYMLLILLSPYYIHCFCSLLGRNQMKSSTVVFLIWCKEERFWAEQIVQTDRWESVCTDNTRLTKVISTVEVAFASIACWQTVHILARNREQSLGAWKAAAPWWVDVKQVHRRIGSKSYHIQKKKPYKQTTNRGTTRERRQHEKHM